MFSENDNTKQDEKSLNKKAMMDVINSFTSESLSSNSQKQSIKQNFG